MTTLDIIAVNHRPRAVCFSLEVIRQDCIVGLKRVQASGNWQVNDLPDIATRRDRNCVVGSGRNTVTFLWLILSFLSKQVNSVAAS